MITVSHLSKRYGTHVVVDDVSFEVAAGRVTGFVGPNGAGKSTTMKMMVGLARPDGGEVRYRGVRCADMVRPAHVVGSVLDARGVHPGRTARNHLLALAHLSDIPLHRIGEVLHEVGLDAAADRRVGGYSLGMRQRLALAGAMLGSPDVLLLDEPSNGLDPDGIRWLRDSLRAFADHGGTVFVSSHLIAELAMFADDLVVIGGGRLLAAEPVAATLARGNRAVVVRSLDAAELASRLDRAGFAVQAQGSVLSVLGATTDAVSRIAFDHQLRVVEISEMQTPLEEILLGLTGATADIAAA
jgi:ABC-2 type transport system ATP-binding protein